MAAEAAGDEAARRGVAPVISAVDAGGALMFLVRPDLAQVASVEVTTDKARTAAIYRRPSKDFEDQARAAGRRRCTSRGPCRSRAASRSSTTGRSSARSASAAPRRPTRTTSSP